MINIFLAINFRPVVLPTILSKKNNIFTPNAGLMYEHNDANKLKQ